MGSRPRGRSDAPDWFSAASFPPTGPHPRPAFYRCHGLDADAVVGAALDLID
jgi:hypothetical protein